MDIQFLYRLGLSYKNALIMIQDRGYNVKSPLLQYEPLQIAGHFYKKAIEQQTSFSTVMRSTFSKGPQTLTLFALDRNYDTLKFRDKMISTDQVKSIAEKISNDPADQAIVLCPYKLSPQAKKESVCAEFFLFDDLLINLPNHVLVPKHTIISLQQIQQVLGKSFDPKNLPILSVNDPISKWYNFKKDSIIYIQNPVMTSFRIVS